MARSGMIWRAAGYFITTVTIAGWLAGLANWMRTHRWNTYPDGYAYPD
jgi:hypothetical protein